MAFGRSGHDIPGVDVTGGIMIKNRRSTVEQVEAEVQLALPSLERDLLGRLEG